jgi:hypothetical protein
LKGSTSFPKVVKLRTKPPGDKPHSQANSVDKGSLPDLHFFELMSREKEKERQGNREREREREKEFFGVSSYNYTVGMGATLVTSDHVYY